MATKKLKTKYKLVKVTNGLKKRVEVKDIATKARAKELLVQLLNKELDTKFKTYNEVKKYVKYVNDDFVMLKDCMLSVEEYKE